MAKKYKKRKKRKSVKQKRRYYDPRTHNRHHLLFIKARWSGRYANKLKLHQYCIVIIPQHTLHKKIHMFVDEVPVASEMNCKAILEALETDMVNNTISLSDTPSKRLKWLIQHFSECEPDTTRALKKQLAIVTEWEWQEFTSKLP